jgi:putative FmdB family regulatory protein
MPTYEYECTKCKKRFEVFHSISAEPLKRCMKCRGKLVRRIGTGSGIIFKGSGFYATDYRSDNYNKGKKSDSEKSTAVSTAKDTKTEKTTAVKSTAGTEKKAS